MRNKRFFAVLIIISISLLILVNPVFAIQFSDIGKHWAAENIKLLADKGIINGYNDGTFKPNKNIAISEFIAMIVKTSGIGYKASSYKKNWYDYVISSALEAGVIIDGEFDKYDRHIKRGEMAIMIVRALGIKPMSQKTTFKDDENIPQNIKEYIGEAANSKIIMGLPNGTFNANGNATRAEAATMIANMLNYIKENSNDENKKPVEDLISNKDKIDAESIKYVKILTLGYIKEKGYFFRKCESNDGEFITTNFSGILAYIKDGKIIEKNSPLPMEETFCFPIKVEYDSFDYLGLYDYGEDTIELISNPFIDSTITFTIEEDEEEATAEEIEAGGPKEPDIKPSPVYATIKSNTKYYSSSTTSSKVIGSIPAGTEVEVIRDRSYKWYNIDYNGKKGWVTSNVLSIPQDPETNSVKLTKEEIEAFINNKGFSSNTRYFIWVDIDRQLVNIFQGSKGNWSHLKSITCATGKNESPTIRGTFTIQDRGSWFYNNSLKSGAKNWVRFNGPYLFHSVAMDSKQRITDNTLGQRASAGCVRMSLEDSSWLYKNMPRGTTVWVN